MGKHCDKPSANLSESKIPNLHPEKNGKNEGDQSKHCVVIFSLFWKFLFTKYQQSLDPWANGNLETQKILFLCSYFYHVHTLLHMIVQVTALALQIKDLWACKNSNSQAANAHKTPSLDLRRTRGI